MESVQSLEKVHTPGTVQTAGVLCAVGGAGWLVDSVVSSAVIQSGGATFVVWEVSWILVQSLLLIGVAGLAFSGAAPGWFGYPRPRSRAGSGQAVGVGAEATSPFRKWACREEFLVRTRSC
jgi:hypothetical protein